MKGVLFLRANDAASNGAQGVAVEAPVWDRVESHLGRTFRYGGSVKLHAAEHTADSSLRLRQFLGMESQPGKFRLIYTPEECPEERTNRQEWWEPGDAPFRGTVNFGGHEWDARTVCEDLTIAVKFFRDFFDHGDLTKVSLDQMRSVWERKSR
jgi:hypothetical protein